MPTEAKEAVYKWHSPHEWLRHKVNHGSLAAVTVVARVLINLVDADDIQRVFQSEMEYDGYFDPFPESNCSPA